MNKRIAPMIATEEKPNRKPTPNPLAKSGLSLIQYNTKQKGWVFESLDSTQKPTTPLVRYCIKQGFLSWFFFLSAIEFRASRNPSKTVLPKFSTKFCTTTVLQGKEGRNMGTYNPHFQNNVPERVCPFCGTSRPLDWFGKELKHEIRDKRTGHVLRTIRYRKYVACWRCRGIKRITTLTDPTRLLGNDLIGSTDFQGVNGDDLIG